MDECLKLHYYLPLSFKSPKEQEYAEFRRVAFETNYIDGMYQFAFLSITHLSMTDAATTGFR